MEQIIFRGKRVKTGEWVFGLLWHYNEKAAAIYSDKLDRLCWVLPETVGQFTGLTDKDGKKIFDGDIVKITVGSGCVDPIIGVIKFENCGFFFKFGKYGKALFGDWVTECYMIGNIHDNPELLEVQ